MKEYLQVGTNILVPSETAAASDALMSSKTKNGTVLHGPK